MEISDYIGSLAIESDKELLNQNKSVIDSGLPAFIFSALRLGCYPCSIRIHNTSREDVYYCIKSLKFSFKNRYHHNFKNDVVYKGYTKFFYTESEVIELIKGKVIICIENPIHLKKNSPMPHLIRTISIFYHPESTELVDNIIKEFDDFKRKNLKKRAINMICKKTKRNGNSFYLKPIEIKNPLIGDLDLHNGAGFCEFNESIVNSLSKMDSHGLVLLHGESGTGKTNYIRYLIHKLDKEMIYLPPDMIQFISDPGFFTFMLAHSGSVLISEDIENAIITRDSKETTTQAVANLLNLSDGLLGDSLHQPIIATFNCELNSIDTALLRKGRLIANYEFNKLSVENAQKLSDQLGFTIKITEPMVLANIYNRDN